ncbi:uncharacterized protein LOC107764917 [Nicotiana tabacum]|uniref:Uncharacterized protein LOC107764917 n=2 Tax=Nicotiana TaxID=4085 RepID=A0A1S3XGE6_TOBAC|nr:PREDICTED: uncharacterized protein LOC104245138 [Nicotiana sylvestris]XP_016438986.1 PREDICTED: uncharacterized protein LOC107764917 [Nicotiana tabacum]
MANSSINLQQFNQTVISLSNFTNLSSLSFPAYSKVHLHKHHQFKKINTTLYHFRLFSRRSFLEYEDEDDLNSDNYSFQEAVALFNSRDYYRCHDVLEALWNQSQEPIRTLLHGILQCAVGFHHLFNQNHKGAMMELGEGLCKLRKFNFENGPFHEFEKEISEVLDFIYRTQLELAACGDDICVTLDQSERSYQLLGGYAAGQKLYSLENDQDYYYLVFSSGRYHGNIEYLRIKLPTIDASEGNLKELEYI